MDDATDPQGLIALADDYPVEFGLLFSPKRQGLEPRYPALSKLAWFAEELPVRWSAHLCGADARSVIERGYTAHEDLLGSFARCQINTADPSVQHSQIGEWAARRNLRAILQCRGAFPQVASVDVLYDPSGGRGISPTSWPRAVNTTYCGYAGGLRPENVAEAVRMIGGFADRYWIDMESGVRDEHDRFDLGKCLAVCQAVYGRPS
ncbi:MAG: hypothetical protein KF686_03560 [Ramlibacter sp.]|nr:hypothetical protein [Ramlibacter sp.]